MKIRKRIAFSIFELVAVLAIITTLVAMIFPVMEKARETGRKASCVSNLKQIGTALSMYLDDYRHQLPRSGNGRIEWADALNDNYIDDKNLFYCPTAAKSTYDWSNLENNNGISYGLSWYLNRRTLNFPKYDTIENRSEKVLMADADVINTAPSDKNKSILHWGDDEPGVSNRHNGGSNVLFSDFHVGWELKTTLEGNYPGWWTFNGELP